MSKILKALISVSLFCFMIGTCWAQGVDAGKSEYQLSCAACHGIDGKGNGPSSAALKVAPTDLTVLAKKNNGVFPFNAIYEVIDGRQTVIAHGTREVPIWGQRYAPLSPNAAVSPKASELYVDPTYDAEIIRRARILAVIDYLNRIQEK
jgi:hypothetical protein